MGESWGEDGSERLRELHHAATYILSATDVETVYETTVETAETVLGFDYCTVFVIKDYDFVVVASSHLEEGEHVAVEDGALTRTFETGEAMLIRDIAESDVSNPIDPTYRSGLSIPLGEEAVLQAVSKTPNYYEPVDLELAELLALHAEAALSQVRSQELVRKQKQKIEQLHRFATELGSCHEEEELYLLMRRASNEILGFDWCTLYTMEDDRFIAVMASECSPVDVGEYPFPKGQSKAREIFETGESHFVEDVHELDKAEPTTDRIRSALQVPVGNIGVYNAAHEQPGMFDEDDLELAELLAGSIAEAYERIKTQEQLRGQNRKLKRQNERLEEFASIVSHDLRNPLNVARGRVELARKTGELEHLNAVENAHKRMEALIEDLLSLARSGLEIDETEPVAIEEVARICWQMVENEEAGLVVELDNSTTIQAAPERLRQLLENLYRNSIEHGGHDVTITVGKLSNGAGFFVEDDGDGIPEEHRTDLFKPGFTTQEEGTGFGLAIVAEIVNAHDWDIRTTESSTGGARFEISEVTLDQE